MDSLKLLQLFINDLNTMLKDGMMFPEASLRGAHFDLHINENVEEDKSVFIDLRLMFQEGDKKHLISYKTFKSNFCLELESRKNGFFRIAYLEIIRIAIFATDSIGELGNDDRTGLPINILSFKTLCIDGLNALNKK